MGAALAMVEPDNDRAIIGQWEYWLQYCWAPAMRGGITGSLHRPADIEATHSETVAARVELCMLELQRRSALHYEAVFCYFIHKLCDEVRGLGELGKRLPKRCPAQWRPEAGVSDEDWARVVLDRAILRLDRIAQGLQAPIS